MAELGFKGLIGGLIKESLWIAVPEYAEVAENYLQNRKIGEIGENATEKSLRELYPDANIERQIKGKFVDGKYTVFDFLVIKEGKIVSSTNFSK